MFEFGSGTLFGFPSGGNTAANPTPMKFGTLQDVSLDISGDIKQLYGQKQFPEAVARGKCKISGKAKFASINGKMMNDLFFGQTMGSGMVKTALDETATVPATPFQITVQNAATFKQDWGVRYASGINAGVPLTRVAASPAAGQYSVNTTTGVYTFSSSDTAASVQISYTFVAATTGTQLNITNQLMGFAPTIQVLLETVYNSNQFAIMLYSVVASKSALLPSRKTSSSPNLISRLSRMLPAKWQTCIPTSNCLTDKLLMPGSPTGPVSACWGGSAAGQVATCIPTSKTRPFLLAWHSQYLSGTGVPGGSRAW